MNFCNVFIKDINHETKKIYSQYSNGTYKNTKVKLGWIFNDNNNIKVIVTKYNNLLTKNKINSNENFLDYINPNLVEVIEMISTADLRNVMIGDYIQFIRKKYYICSELYDPIQRSIKFIEVPI